MVFKFALIVFCFIVSALFLTSIFLCRHIERTFPPIGEFADVKGSKLHFVDTDEHTTLGAPAIVFIHGAGGNLRDHQSVYQPRLSEEFRLIFVDRPGHGYSESFAGSNDPKMQAASIAALLEKRDIEKAIIVGHSLGGVVAAAFGVLFPQKTAGLVFLAPVSHPWGTGVDWHYDLGNTPIIGWLFSWLVAPVAGSFLYEDAITGVFAPNRKPDDYAETSGTRLLLRPNNFHENAKDVARVAAHVESFHSKYSQIDVPTVILHGDADDTVSLEIHSINGLSKDIGGAKLIVLEGVGHKPDYIAADQIETEIRNMAAAIE